MPRGAGGSCGWTRRVGCGLRASCIVRGRRGDCQGKRGRRGPIRPAGQKSVPPRFRGRLLGGAARTRNETGSWGGKATCQLETRVGMLARWAARLRRPGSRRPGRKPTLTAVRGGLSSAAHVRIPMGEGRAAGRREWGTTHETTHGVVGRLAAGRGRLRQPAAPGQMADEAEREKDLAVRTIGDVTELAFVGPVQVSGVALVTGLAGTGGSPNGEYRVLLEQYLQAEGRAGHRAARLAGQRPGAGNRVPPGRPAAATTTTSR